jgi:hypothetical protein
MCLLNGKKVFDMSSFTKFAKTRARHHVQSILQAVGSKVLRTAHEETVEWERKYSRLRSIKDVRLWDTISYSRMINLTLLPINLHVNEEVGCDAK